MFVVVPKPPNPALGADDVKPPNNVPPVLACCPNIAFGWLVAGVAPKPAVPNDVVPVPKEAPLAAGAVGPNKPVVGWPNGFAPPNGVVVLAGDAPFDKLKNKKSNNYCNAKIQINE